MNSPMEERQDREGMRAAEATPRTGDILLAQGLITPDQLKESLAHQDGHGGRIAEILCGLSNTDVTKIGQVVAEILGVAWSRPDQAAISSQVLERIPMGVVSHYCVMPIGIENNAVYVATSSPQDVETLAELELLIKKPIVPILAMPMHIREGIKKHYGVGADTINEMRSLDVQDIILEDTGHHSLDDDAEDASIIRFVNQVIGDAHRLEATDIHLEPQEDSFRIRYRVDGLLEEIPVPRQLKQYQSAITSRIKVMARLDIAEQRLPQDGRIPLKMGGGEVFDLRVSVLPTPLGEGIDLRLLRRTSVHMSLEELGYAQSNLKQLHEAASRPNGIILITGPTGSGKTTSLYALLEKINTPDRKIITIEDPIEYNMPGMLQLQVHDDIGFSFASALRSILRHDPDIVLVGEIRDQETAEIALRMAMTGHLVLSTLHTNDAASTIARLIDMGQEPYLLASTINCVVAQRLIRLICPHCKTPTKPDDAILEPFKQMGLAMPDQFHKGQGCELCRKSGYLGRTGIHEVFPIDDDFGEHILARSPASKFRHLAMDKGIKQMREDGWERMLAGQTTIDEILRVTQALET
jgi:general secretion pathway protein E